jgi:hypothetical protein
VPWDNATTKAHTKAEAPSELAAAPLVPLSCAYSNRNIHRPFAKETDGFDVFRLQFRDQSSSHRRPATTTTNFLLWFLPGNLEVGWKMRAGACNSAGFMCSVV